jgi:hypothetical protein
MNTLTDEKVVVSYLVNIVLDLSLSCGGIRKIINS